MEADQATTQHRPASRLRKALLHTLLLGAAAAPLHAGPYAVVAALAPTGPAVLGEDAPPVIVQAADRLRELAALDIGSTRPGESPSARLERMWLTVEQELARLTEFARIATVAEWRSARVPSAVVEISIRAGEAHRESLFGYVKELVAVAPNARCRRAMVRASLRVLEPLVESASATQRWEPVVDALLVELESGGLDTPFTTYYRRRLQALRVGTRLPRFVARDTAGNELRSAQLEGRIVVFRFWDPSSAASVAVHEEDARLVRRFWDAPFDLVGVSASPRRAEHLSFIDRARFGGTQLFDGPISNELADELAKDAGRFCPRRWLRLSLQRQFPLGQACARRTCRGG